MIDIASKLFPNVLTILTQLCATGIIYIMYKKHIHSHVIAYLDARQAMMEEATQRAKEVKDIAEKQQKQLEEQQAKMKSDLEAYKLGLEQQAQKDYQEKLRIASLDIARRKEAANLQIERDKIAMVKEVENHAVDLAMALTQKTMQEIEINDDQLLKSFERKLSKHYDRS